MPENSDQVTAAAAKNVEIAAVRVAPQRLLNLQRQAVHAAPRVRPANRQPHPHPARNRDHRRRNAAITAEASSGGTDAEIRTREPPATSTSIEGVGADVSDSAGLVDEAVEAGTQRTVARLDGEFVSPARPGHEHRAPVPGNRHAGGGIHSLAGPL